ncbi:hypothetical protein tpqmel_1007, partial [Candidatus Gastranaerophilus sp. (ex Termes propinquus)]
ITIGFAHQNSVLQAKAESKLKPLEKALGEVFEKNLEINFIQMSKDADPKETVKAEIQTPKIKEVPPPEPFLDEGEPLLGSGVTASKRPEANTGQNMPEEPAPVVRKTYSRKAQDMIESFSGKIIES